MLADLELAYLSAGSLAAGYRAGDFTPVEVHDAIADVIAAREPTLNALAVHDPEQSREAAVLSAQRWSRAEPRSPLDGVPITLKENIARRGVPMSTGSAAVPPTVPERSAPITERVEAAGLVIMGSTVMPDWGMLSSGVSSRHGITRSPLNPALTTGGSSSGAGACAAGGYGPLHVGTDIGGSIRLPGTWLGLAALKPSFGRIPLDVPYLGRVAGPLARSVADLAALMPIVSGFDSRDPSALPPADIDWTALAWDPAGTRVGLHLNAGCGAPADPAVAAAVTASAEAFERAGAQVVPIAPFMTQELLDSLDLFWRVRSWNDLRSLDEEHRRLTHPFVAAWCQAGSDTSGRRVLRAYQDIMEIQRRTVAATEAVDVVLSPVAPVAAFPATDPMPYPEVDTAMAHIGFTAPYSMSGQPAMSVDCGALADGRRIGVQVSGRRFDDLGVLRAGLWFEQQRPAGAHLVWPATELVPQAWTQGGF